MMLILLPNLPSLSELITQMPQKEVQILIRLRESLLEGSEQLVDFRFLLRVSYLLGEEIQILFGVG
jgi:hypothetical protein